MTRRKRYDPDKPRLYGTQEAAEYMGISRRNLTYLLANNRMIEPLARLACGPIWSESQLDEMVFAWRDNPRRKMDPDQVRRMTLSRQLGELERRWATLVAAAAEGDNRKQIVAVWEGREATNRRKGGRSALATPTEARKALAEAKLLRLVADLRDKDLVFRGIAAELDEAANLRKQIEALDKAREEQAVVAETVNTHTDT